MKSCGINVTTPPLFKYEANEGNDFSVQGKTIIPVQYDFSSIIQGNYFALGYAFLGKAYPHKLNWQQAFFFQTLMVYPSNVDMVSADVVQFQDQYDTPEGMIYNQWQVIFDVADKLLTVQPLLTKQPGFTEYVPTPEIPVAFFKATLFTFDSYPTQTQMPFPT